MTARADGAAAVTSARPAAVPPSRRRPHPYHSRCVICGVVFRSEAAARRHTDTTGHCHEQLILHLTSGVRR